MRPLYLFFCMRFVIKAFAYILCYCYLLSIIYLLNELLYTYIIEMKFKKKEEK